MVETTLKSNIGLSLCSWLDYLISKGMISRNNRDYLSDVILEMVSMMGLQKKPDMPEKTHIIKYQYTDDVAKYNEHQREEFLASLNQIGFNNQCQIADKLFDQEVLLEKEVVNLSDYVEVNNLGSDNPMYALITEWNHVVRLLNNYLTKLAKNGKYSENTVSEFSGFIEQMIVLSGITRSYRNGYLFEHNVYLTDMFESLAHDLKLIGFEYWNSVNSDDEEYLTIAYPVAK
ncbi:hypothetical protein [Ligilactobacillus equi]|uniref:hypothetical protein n=1 Tax=Ligilactobacillus equi TaxID=137357 RepID=UPI00041C6F88|nr:hypothetical protein [Ligilactobacillus equi]